MKAPSRTYQREVQVGLFLLTCILVIAAFSFKITDSPIFRRGTTIKAYLNDATGLYEKSKVKLAGINVGIVSRIELEAGKARITMLIDQGIELPNGAIIVPRPLGILGDKYMEIVLPKPPGAAPAAGDTQVAPAPDGGVIEGPDSDEVRSDKGAWNWPEIFSLMPSAYAQPVPAKLPATKQGKLKEGDVIATQDQGATIDDLAREMAKVAADLKIITGTLRGLVEGKDMNSPLGRTLRNAEHLTANLNSVVVENREDIGAVLRSLTKMLRKFESVLQNVDKGELGGDLQALAKSADNLAQTLRNIESITGKIDRGEGTLGRLINDPTTASEFNKSLITINAALDQAQRTRLIVEALPEYNFDAKAFKTYLGLTLAPRDNTAYVAQVVVDNQGTTDRKITRETVDDGPEKVTVTEEQNPNALRISFQYVKRFWDTSFRFGLFENSGGAGVDQHLFKDGLKLSAEIYNFREDRDPLLKAYVSAHFLGVFKVYAGADNLLKSPVFVAGLGLSFSDEDLKTVLLLPGVP